MNEENKVLEISIDDIVPNRFQPRLEFEENSLNELANSIKEHGIIQPLVVRPLGDKYEIIAGERRYKASQVAGLSKVPAIVKTIDDDKSAELAVVENLQRKALTPIEEAKSYQKLLDSNISSQEELAKKMGVSQPTVANKIRLLGLAEEVQEALMKSKISERHARSLLLLSDEADQVDMLNKILENRMTVKQTTDAIKEILSKQKIEPLGEGEKPVEAEEIPDHTTIKDVVDEKPKLDFNSLLMSEDELENKKIESEETEEKDNKIEKSEEIKEADTEPTEVLTMEQETSQEEKKSENDSEILNFNTQINPFQETEVLDFGTKEEKKVTPSTEKLDEENDGNDDAKELTHDLGDIINETRGMCKRIEKAGFVVDTEEFDFEDMYQVTIKIQK